MKMNALSFCSLMLNLLLGVQRSGCIPMSQQTCISELLRIKQGEALNLPCQSPCSGEPVYSWWRVAEEEGDSRDLLELTGSTLTKNPVHVHDGGQYVCKCDGPECRYNISILPEVSFSADEVATHYGASLDLTCTVTGYPVNFSVIRDKHGSEVPGQIRKKLGEHSVKTFAVIGDAMEGEYVCSVETHYMGEIVGRVEKSVSVLLYTPPSIIYTTEYIVYSETQFGRSGQLSCTVQTSPDTDSRVTWWTNGTQLENSDKYVIDSVKTGEEDVIQYQLTVRNLQHADIGSYLCQLSSDFAPEDSQPAWIQVDFRKRKVVDYEEHDIDSEYEEVTETDAPRERSNIVLFVLCGLVVTFGAVGVWRMRQKKGNLLLGFAEKQQDRGTRRKMDSTPTTTPNLSSSSLMHRKLKSSA